jgi:integrase
MVAVLTGMRWGELAVLRWNDVRLDKPVDDGAVSGPGRLRHDRLSGTHRSSRSLTVSG